MHVNLLEIDFDGAIREVPYILRRGGPVGKPLGFMDEVSVSAFV